MDPIKEAFDKIKSDIYELRNELKSIRNELKSIKTHQQTNKPTQIPTTPTQKYEHSNTNSNTSIGNEGVQTNNYSVQSLYNTNSNTSIGNEGVPTNTPTHQQTHQQTQNISNLSIKTDFRQANEIIESLDGLKRGIRLKFKRLTTQEMLVFSHLYELQEQKYDEITYKTLASRMNLSESSIRDYINKLLKKGIPIEKTRLNNKTILLSISQDLKNIANLTTIQSLRQI